MIISISCVWHPFYEADKLRRTYQNALKESHKWLASIAYQEQLIFASCGNQKLVDALERYNAKQALHFDLNLEELVKKDL